MNVTIIGAGNSGLAMAAHLAANGNRVALWNRSSHTIGKLMETRTIHCDGVIRGSIPIDVVTNDLRQALEGTEAIFVTTPAFSHKDLARQIALHLDRPVPIVLNPGRTFGALEFFSEFQVHNREIRPIVAETQTIIYTCRKTADDCVNIIAMKSDVLLSTFDASRNWAFISHLPECLHPFYIPAKSMVETSVGNVGMILHCAPLLLNAGWTENPDYSYNYYHDGITPTIGRFLEKIDEERIEVSCKLGHRVESTVEWFRRTYKVEGETIFDCVQNNRVYRSIAAPNTLYHRYILEDVPYGLVPLEGVGKGLGLPMKYTGMVIDLASLLLDVDFRQTGRNLHLMSFDKARREGRVAEHSD
jgi:NAD/NADP octopine/nopaline dehydrogenase, alpha-helical domain./NAD-dependent glycerol-3-phosphate dehydrogenase N-terminus.